MVIWVVHNHQSSPRTAHTHTHTRTHTHTYIWEVHGIPDDHTVVWLLTKMIFRTLSKTVIFVDFKCAAKATISTWFMFLLKILDPQNVVISARIRACSNTKMNLSEFTHTHTHTSTCTYTHTHTHTHKHKRIASFSHTHTHTHTRAHTHKHITATMDPDLIGVKEVGVCENLVNGRWMRGSKGQVLRLLI